jgi:hypothetical protein
MVYPENKSKEGWNTQHGPMVEVEQKVHGCLLPIVVGDQENWLDVLHKVTKAK